MTHFHKNLLEAFQDANDERAGSDPASAGPFAGAPPDEPEGRGNPQNILPTLTVRDSRVVLVIAGVAIVAFVAGLAAGRGFGGATRAAEPDTSLELHPGPVAEAPAALNSGLEPGEPVNGALRDPANAFTVLAVTYGASEGELDLAYATYYHFAELGLPVAYPVKFAGYLYVLLGAAPSRADLLALRDGIRGLEDPDGREGEYAEAYIVGIDNVFPR